jgi:hypothetical protein
MMKRVIVSCALAVSLALSSSSGVWAQVVIDGVGISPADLPRVQVQCNALAARSLSSLTDNEGADLVEPSPDPASAYSAGANRMDNALTRFDLNRLTLNKCRAAGLVR